MKEKLRAEYLMTSLVYLMGIFGVIGALAAAFAVVLSHKKQEKRTYIALVLTVGVTLAVFFVLLILFFVSMLVEARALVVVMFVFIFLEALAAMAFGILTFFMPGFMSVSDGDKGAQAAPIGGEPSPDAPRISEE
ncbi:MAG: hypothetical protein LBH24_04345 [Clostridiales bacterium]|jgi:hypothetical protein|nr:hypothetical protein [Clostridiales bacterium]